MADPDGAWSGAPRFDGGVQGGGAFGGPGPLPRQEPLLGPGDLLAGLVALVVTVVAGALLGLLWAATAPHLDVPAVIGGSESAFSAQAGVDVYFGTYGLIFGAVAGVVAWWRAKDAGWTVPAGLAVGGFGGSLLAGWIGHERRSHQVLSQLPPRANALAVQIVDFGVRAHGLYLVYPLAAVGLFALLTWVTTRSRGASRKRPAAPTGTGAVWDPPPAEGDAPPRDTGRWWSAPR